MTHQKHAFVQKPSGGKFHRNELAFLGAPCGVIQKLTRSIQSQLGSLDLGYVDADHGEGSEAPDFGGVYTDKISHHQFTFDRQDYSYRFRQLFNDKDAVLVNGNHFAAAQQIVIINGKKEESLSRKLDRLTHVRAFVVDEGMTAPFEFLREAVANSDEVPVFPITAIDEIAKVVKESFSLTPVVKGLVLTGGKSSRMGQDKGAIAYYGKPQREHVADMLSDLCAEVHLSVQKPNQVKSDYDLLPDAFLDLGPLGGILSAFRQDPNAAWMAVATDIPLLDTQTLNRLITERDTSKLATCFLNEETKFPEPLITLWEPRAYPQLLQFLALGYSCPRKVLINNEVNILSVPQHLLKNVNTPEEYEEVQNLIGG